MNELIPRRHPAVAMLVGVLLTTGCTLHHVETSPKSDIALPAGFQQGGGGELDTANRWWTVFGDEKLDSLVAATVANNLDIKRAWARLSQARAIAKASGAAAYPQVDAAVGVGVSQGVNPKKDLPGENHFAHVGNYSLTVSVGYEVDLWGRVSSGKNAANYDIMAARQDVSAMALAMAAQAVEAWFSIAEAKAQLALIETQRAINQTFVELLEERFRFGQADSVSIFQQRQQLAASTSQVPLIEARIRLLKHQLAIIQGKPAGSFKDEPSAALPSLGIPPATGLPADVLKNRPDVRAAQLRLVAADYRVGVAIADQYPALRLTAGTGLQSTDIAEFITSWVWNLLANLVAPLFDGGRRAAEVERNQAVLTDLVHAYGSVILKALKEVDDALVQEHHQRRYVGRLTSQAKLADSTLGEARVRYLEGGGDYLSVLNALAAKQSIELAQLGAQRTLLTYRVAVYRALGGTWAKDLAEPAARSKAAKEPAQKTESKTKPASNEAPASPATKTQDPE